MTSSFETADEALADSIRITGTILDCVRNDSFEDLESLLEERGRHLALFAERAGETSTMPPESQQQIRILKEMDQDLLEYMQAEKEKVLSALSSLRSQSENPHKERHSEPILVNQRI